MNDPGIYNMGDFALTTAGTVNGTPVTDLEGMLACNIQGRFAYGSGGTNTRLYIQTSLDQGTTWIDIACVLFGLVSEHKVLNFSGLTPKLELWEPTDGALADDIVIDGVLGDRLRAKIVTTGTYGGSTVLSIRLMTR